MLNDTKKIVPVTKAFLPPVNEYTEELKRIWGSGQLTNQGSLLLEFEKSLRAKLGVKNIHVVSNGTVALQLSLNALGIREGEIITTPFSYVATVSSILWERCNPVFVDIDSETLCIDPTKIEDAITEKTKAILPVHIFGRPCNIERIEEVAKKYSIKVIYDGAHSFGTFLRGKSLLDYGDISTCSFHATKPFHTIEGGCLIVKDDDVSERVDLIKRFGHNFDKHQVPGINAKASEFQAAMGLCNLRHIDEIIAKRKRLTNTYNEKLSDRFKTRFVTKGIEYNYSYYPIVLSDEKELLKKVADLNKENIYPRRYFYPSLNKLPYLSFKQSCPVSEDIAIRILCLPLYFQLRESDINKICNIINK